MDNAFAIFLLSFALLRLKTGTILSTFRIFKFRGRNLNFELATGDYSPHVRVSVSWKAHCRRKTPQFAQIHSQKKRRKKLPAGALVPNSPLGGAW